jgi:hypothetical protein
VEEEMNKTLQALGSGVAGAVTLTLIHQTAKRVTDKAPRADILGMRAIARTMRKANTEPPADDQLFWWSLLGDLVSNSLYYSLASAGDEDKAWTRGGLLGLGAGVGALALPGPLGLGSRPTNRTRATQIMTIAWYLAGGLAAAATARCLARLGEQQDGFIGPEGKTAEA